MELGRFGVWAGGPWRDRTRQGEAVEVAAELESLGYTTLWKSAGFRDRLEESFAPLLEATTTMSVASGIASIWHTTPEEAVIACTAFDASFPGRFLLGLGASHASIVADTGQIYARPYQKTVAYLDALDETEVAAVGPDRRILAALGPKMLALGARRSLGVHPYFVPLEHTKTARALAGDGALIAVEQAVVLETDPDVARRVARQHVARYLELPNYANNLRRLGFDESDLVPPGPDLTVDRMVAWGDAETVAGRLRDHLDAGADHVCVQVLATDSERFPRTEYAALAAALL